MEQTDRTGVVMAEVRDTPLSVDEVMAAVRHPRAGAIATFVGIVRERDHDRDVTGLDYSAHPTAVAALTEIAERLAARPDVLAIAAVHRTGALEIGDLAVVAAVSAPHRAPAFEVCRELIDTLKAQVPIWKHQQFTDGTDEWVGLP
ncbi:molybdenum cofactor biosynthesis protein MoaE [Segeticoccus rhizosphaerae]|jgi:molybdopterin synthase catalytic subunit|uniref:molybdenum cofactor biosynthesis protein MoaE n=1 Tax=Segeticoccus rhizosphaerae TaxID=1104777 RepID=UPI0010C0A32A|nr:MULTISPECIES: molybdenum cofactor biosynthesis protein MoaE [Intrasporangiaceae]